MSDKHEKDIHRYSYSRLSTFKTCPRKHHYIYVEQLPEPDNEYVLTGKMFHECIEAILTGKDPEPIYQEWHDAVDHGKIHLERDLLEYVVNAYFTYYYKDYEQENTLLIEHEFNKPIKGDDYMNMRVDQAYEISGLLGVRDTKSTRSPLKYKEDDVRTNMQLLTYVESVEEKLHMKVNFIEIDEVRIAKLDTSVPLVQRGKPSTSMDVLSLTTADLYRSELEAQNLLDEPKYKFALEKLEQRGHPLFKRTKVQLLNRSILDSNNEELESLYIGASNDLKYRIKDDSKCYLCPFKTLCELEQFGASEKNKENSITGIE